ncbi:ABC transporter ATP-binding protein [Solwaraspora sp. WMMD1047]|uniref:ABC transporter ATP-binding protein n=1 Tax=Solwaraspora sp. WMMD1047 TaxID=3016102 RepID=UPI00241682A7|nr:ABC transporter ATP-binding protein [Solwaraspora sp. WMMD1047]MDG4833406.1 ABC transporter ATP-binding protein [Solwaraspora sp. WMMD1047]
MSLRLPHSDPGTPDTRGPLLYIWWLVRSQPWRVLRGAAIGTIWMVGLALRPYLIARAIDDGLRTGDHRALLFWVAAIVVAGLLLAYAGIMRHRTMTFVREDASARSAAVLLRQLTRIGAVLPRKLAAGEVATVGGSDIVHTSQVLTMTGPGVGAVIAYAVVAVLLWSVSPTLALCILVGVPAVGLAVGPLLRRLERVESAYRREQGELTTRAGDIVAGLRVLAGVGGRGLFARRYATRSQALLAKGYRVGAVGSWVQALTLVIPGLFLAAVVWLAARLAAEGTITIGQLVAAYGYVAVLMVPVWFLLEGTRQTIRGRVSARRIVALLNLTPDPVDGSTAEADSPGRAVAGSTGGAGSSAEAGGGGSSAEAGGSGWVGGEPWPAPDRAAELRDPATGLTVPAGRLVGVAAADPAEAGALADRLARFAPSDVSWGGVPLTAIELAEVRARVLLADHESYLFAGTLRDVLRAGRTTGGDAEIRAALRTAAAEDVADALPSGLDSEVGARARTLSGGQRQRVRLARALLAEPEVLILVDPTSAVDAHTEARIADRLRTARSGRTTVLLATSPLLLERADTVAYLRDGRVVATGSHAELLAREPGYRALVARDTEEVRR